MTKKYKKAKHSSEIVIKNFRDTKKVMKNFYHFVGTDIYYINPIRGYVLSSIQLDENEKALSLVNKFLQKNDNYNELYWDRYKIKIAMNDKVEALKDFDKYKRMFPNKFGAQNEPILTPASYSRTEFCWF